MATITGSTNHANWDFKLEVTENSTSIANNTSSVTVAAYIGRNGVGSYMHGASISCTVNVTGCNSQTIKYSNSNRVDIAVGQWLHIGSVTFTVPHNDDGSKTIAVSASFSNSISPKSGSASGTVKLTTIARKSAPTLSANSVAFGNTITVYTNRKSDSFTHHLYYSINGGSEVGITNGIEDEYTWTIPSDLMENIPSATSATITFKLYTFNDGTNIGNNTVTFTATVPSSVKPTVSLSVSDPMGYFSTYEAYIQGKSKFQIDITASGIYGSSIKSYSTTADGSTYTDSNITTEVIKNSGELTIKVTVKDSRGRSASASKEVTVLAYAVPKISSMSVARCNADGTANAIGAYLKVTFSATITSLNSKNTATYKVQYKKKSATSYTTVTVSAYSGKYSVSGGTYVFSANTGSTYDVTLLAIDAFAETPKSATGGTVDMFISRFKDGVGIAFNKIAEIKNAFEVNWDAYFYKTMRVDGVATFNGRVIQKQGGYTHYASGTTGSSGYIKIAQIVITGTYANTPIGLKILHRGKNCQEYEIRFASINSTDPTLTVFCHLQDKPAWLVKSATSTWDLYVLKTESYDSVCVTDVTNSQYNIGKITINWTDEQVSLLPDECVESTNSDLLQKLETHDNAISNLTANVPYKFYAGTKVVTTSTSSTSIALVSLSELNSIFGVTDCSNNNTAVFAANGDGSAQSVHVEGCAYTNSNWYATLSENPKSGSFRVNFLVVYFG